MASADEHTYGERKHRRRRRGDNSDTKRRQHADSDRVTTLKQSVTSADEAFRQPQDLAALREARLKSLAVPTAERKKMKIEYEYSRPRKPTATVRIKSAKAGSRSLFDSKSSVSARSTSKSAATRNDDDAQYVYRPAAVPNVAHRDFQKEHDAQARKDRRMSAGSSSEKPKLVRRRTEPAPKLRRVSTVSTPRPRMQKGITSVDIAQITTNEKDKGFTKQDSVDSAATGKTTQSKRQSSLIGSLFAKPTSKLEKQVSCLTCGSDDIPVSKSARLPCSHRMCHSCLKRIFKMSIKDPAHMPPRCCTEQHIDLKHVDTLFDQEFKKTWNRKFKEYNAKNRIYCPRKGCGEWIQPKHMRTEAGRKFGVCPKCKYAVCSICNQKAHKSRECPKDPALKQLNEIAEQAGWRKCYNCSAMVELKEGCNHMTCRCLAEFCMVCGLKWKGCDCPWFNYDAVDDLHGNPVRYQQELDRRQDQERRDEEMARQIAGLGIGRRNRNRQQPDTVAVEQRANGVEVDNSGLDNININFLQQAREALTANYQNAEWAARGLLGGWLTGRDNPLPAPLPDPPVDEAQMLQQEPPSPSTQRRTYHQYRARNRGGNRHVVG